MHVPDINKGPSRVAGDPDGMLGHPIGDAELDKLFQTLRTTEDVSPRAGFYARVMDRIEAQGGNSIWQIFLQPWFGRRLAVASAVLMLLMGVALFLPGSDMDNQMLAGSPVTVTLSGDAMDTTPGMSAVSMRLDSSESSRDAVLVDLVTYQEH